MNLVYKELTKLIDDYYRCESMLLKEQILSDVQLLTDALCYLDAPTYQIYEKL